MLELHILFHLMKQEARSNQKQGRLLGYSLSHYRSRHNIPKGTFYRALNILLEGGYVVKQKRGFYIVSDDFRKSCNHMKHSRSTYSLFKGNL
jgi:hypothetical protein